MEWNYEGFIDQYGYPVFDTPKKETLDPHGDVNYRRSYTALGK